MFSAMGLPFLISIFFFHFSLLVRAEIDLYDRRASSPEPAWAPAFLRETPPRTTASEATNKANASLTLHTNGDLHRRKLDHRPLLLAIQRPSTRSTPATTCRATPSPVSPPCSRSPASCGRLLLRLRAAAAAAASAARMGQVQEPHAS